ncbi:MAG: hypothetical protein BWY76_00810 [bacterium ADurb.Bin429]|nr:MAG: hypothetical protein BWY76_00810 [bacterium ADurb.Bin429]
MQTLTLPALPAEGFAIADGVVIRAADDLGFVAGVGKYLRNPAWRGAGAPDKPFRLIYFATHFHNWYHEAPLEDVERYIQDLALWGYNALAVWFDMHHYTGIDDPAARAMVDRLKAMLAAANRIGMGAVLLVLANEGYAGSPEALRADWRDGQNGYFRQLYHYHVELCPSNPDGLALLLRWHEERLAVFADVDMQAVIIWPYDQGGCTCAACAPWGANGYLRVAEPLARLVKARFPRAKTVLSTWDFDLCINGEWEGLRDAFRTPPDWADYLMAENRGNMVPEFVLAEGAPGGLPLVGFPEISMHQCFPWGGFGANPLPARSEYLWGAVSAKYAGGMPYSEGFFEDMNKAFHAQFYWHADRPALETAREYLTYEFGSAAAEPLLRAITLFEETLPRHRDGADRFILDQPDGVDEAYALVQQAEALLPETAKTAWRWRLLALRAFLDHELLHHDFHITAAAETALEELERLYCATAESAMGVSPPTKAARERSGHW